MARRSSLARENERLEHEIEETRSDWERKQSDSSVPGANPPESE